MSDHVYKKIELVGSSSKSVEDAIQNAVTAASQSLDHVNWFEVQEVRGDIVDGKIAYYQAVIKIGFRLDRDA
jgi:flavin-binding protein dodecin